MSFLEKWFGFDRDELYDRGMRSFDQGQYEEAIVALQAVTDRTHDPATKRLSKFYTAESYTHLGLRALEQENFDAASTMLKHAVEIHPNFPDLHFNLALAYRGCGRLDLHKIELAEAVAINPRYARAVLFQGIVAYEEGDHETGLELIHHAVSLDANLGGDRYKFGLKCHQDGEYDRAASNFLAMENREARDANAIAKCGDKFSREGLWTEAVQEYEKALDLQPRYADIRCKYGQALLQLNELDAAANQFRMALNINSRYVDALAYLGVTLRRQGDWQGAQSAFKEAVNLNPNHPIASYELDRPAQTA
ncbi:MAG: tetratricopeptide repeat protein [Armatimonadetes bacterium]|nr:tetratricopeptide repeat protein [Armatimonadota bacterium]